jgi:hypothetical protein
MRLAILSLITGLLLGGYLVHRLQSPTTVTKVQTVTNEVVKERIVTKTLPNGTKTETKTIIEDRVVHQDSEKITPPSFPQSKNIIGLSKTLTAEYEFMYGRKFGNFGIVGTIRTDKTVGLGVIWEF